MVPGPSLLVSASTRPSKDALDERDHELRHADDEDAADQEDPHRQRQPGQRLVQARTGHGGTDLRTRAVVSLALRMGAL